jgi:hypothetical protein
MKNQSSGRKSLERLSSRRGKVTDRKDDGMTGWAVVDNLETGDRRK